MTPPVAAARPRSTGFRIRLLVAMMLVVSAVTAVALFFAQRNQAAGVQRDLEREFRNGLDLLHAVQAVRQAALAERCRTLARKPRIHAALEDNALDLLYPSARDELLNVMDGVEPESREPSAPVFRARFYRFLDGNGAVIPPPDARQVGRLESAEEAQLALSGTIDKIQTGYLLRAAGNGDEMIDEIIALPIVSSETGGAIAALVLGFNPADLLRRQEPAGIRSGIWVNGRLHLPVLPRTARIALAQEIAGDMAATNRTENSFAVQVEGSPCLLFYLRLNPGSLFAPAYEVCIYPLADSITRQRRLFWQFTGAAALLILGAFIASHFISIRLSVPVEKLAVDSEQNRTQRERAEAALELTHGELQRAARFSADASHQLKTPVTVLRAGLEELLAGEKLVPEVREEVSTLVHQTFRLTSVIEDLLLLSRLDAGRLQLDFTPVNLTQLIEAGLDDLGALPEGPDLAIESHVPAALLIEGEKRYTMLILQNLLENARKYNRPGGRISVTVRLEAPVCILTIGNTGQPIPTVAQEHIFQRFHRGAMGENVPGHGLGLNLARELARLHRGDLRLARSDADWTEFEVRFRLTQPTSPAPSDPA